MSLSKPANTLSPADQEMITKQTSRLLEAMPLLFQDSVTRIHKAEIKALRDELERTKAELSDTRKSGREAIKSFVGGEILFEAIKTFNIFNWRVTCHCRYCSEILGQPQLCIPGVKCLVNTQLVYYMELADVKFTWLKSRDGRPVHHVDAPPVPADFPAPDVCFSGDSVSHLPYHLVFAQKGNPYVFSYGELLTSCTSASSPEIVKLHDLIQYIHEKARY
jgi:uncharacterized small protein (DUF1192 family)